MLQKKQDNCEKYGRLYNWKSATKACPEGWRLPTDEEWWAMVDFYGGAIHVGVSVRTNGAGLIANKFLIREGESGFNANFGGRRDLFGVFDFIEKVGVYWSTSKKEDDTAGWAYGFQNYKSGSTQKSWEWKKSHLSCRCIKVK